MLKHVESCYQTEPHVWTSNIVQGFLHFKAPGSCQREQFTLHLYSYNLRSLIARPLKKAALAKTNFEHSNSSQSGDQVRNFSFVKRSFMVRVFSKIFGGPTFPFYVRVVGHWPID